MAPDVIAAAGTLAGKAGEMVRAAAGAAAKDAGDSHAADGVPGLIAQMGDAAVADAKEQVKQGLREEWSWMVPGGQGSAWAKENARSGHPIRNLLEGAGRFPRNSPASSVIHTAGGMLATFGITLGVAQLMPKDKRQGYLHASDNALKLAPIGVFLTAGMQANTPQLIPLDRGINPLYFLAVGIFATSWFMIPKFENAYDN
jgi:hypothetical protein